MKRTAISNHQKRWVKAGLDPITSSYNASWSHLFEGTSGEHDMQLGKYYRVEAHSDHHDNLIQQFRRHPDVEHAYISPSLIIPDAEFTEAYKAKLKKRAEAAVKTPNLRSTQEKLYQSADKDGMDIDYSQSNRGGRGDGVEVFQIEFDWLHSHEDLQNRMRFAGFDGPIGTHATGAAGVVGADENNVGYTGIVPNAAFTARSLYFDQQSAKAGKQNLARAFQWCVDNGKAGDVIMVIIVMSMNDDGVSGPLDWYPEYFDVIKRATDKGMIVVSSAGNEGASLDNASK